MRGLRLTGRFHARRRLGGQGSAATGDVAGSAVPGFNPQDGNFNAQATDVNVPVVGPALSIQRTYNSLAPDMTGAFGARLDFGA